jgi:hypothetical protein
MKKTMLSRNEKVHLLKTTINTQLKQIRMLRASVKKTMQKIVKLETGVATMQAKLQSMDVDDGVEVRYILLFFPSTMCVCVCVTAINDGLSGLLLPCSRLIY